MTSPDSNVCVRRTGLTRRSLICRTLAGSGLLLLTACNRLSLPSAAGGESGKAVTGTPVPTLPKRGGTLHISQQQDINPASVPHVLGPANAALYGLIYDTLVSYDTQLKPQPRLATSWEWSTDFLQLTLTLRPGVKFHTGRSFTSQDAKFNLERVADPSTGSQWLNYAKQMQLETPDPNTLVIKYDAPRVSSFDALAGTFIADPETLDQTKNGKTFVGTGPFRFKEWIQGDHFLAERNPDYWQVAKPYLDQIELRIAPDLQSGVVNLEAGAVDWMVGVPGQDAQRLQKDPTYKVLLNGNGSSFFYLGLDVSAPALADKRVRQAMGYALDRQRLVDTALFGFGRPASILWPRQSLAYDATQDQTYTYNLDKARQLLAAANWDPNTTISLTLSNAFPPTHSMAEIYQQDLARIGVKTAIQSLDTPAFLPRLQRGEFGGAWMTSMGFMNQSPATFFLSALPVRVPNASNFETPSYKGLIEQTYSEPDTQKLKSILNELTQITLDEAFVVPIAESFSGDTGIHVTRSTVQDISWDDLGNYAFQDIWLQH